MQRVNCLVVMALVAVLSSAGAAFAESSDLKKGLESFKRSDWIGAIPYLERAAQEGEAEAQQKLGYILWKGGELDSAERLLKSAAVNGDPVSQVYYYIFLVDRYVGDADRLSEARQWLEQAAANNHPRAMTILARILENEDPGAALILYLKMVDLGQQPAVERLIRAYEGQELGLSRDAVEIARLKSLRR